MEIISALRRNFWRFSLKSAVANNVMIDCENIIYAFADSKSKRTMQRNILSLRPQVVTGVVV